MLESRIEGPGNQGDEEAMSPEIRALIFSFGEPDAKREWDPDAFTRRAAAAPRLAPTLAGVEDEHK